MSTLSTWHRHHVLKEQWRQMPYAQPWDTGSFLDKSQYPITVLASNTYNSSITEAGLIVFIIFLWESQCFSIALNMLWCLWNHCPVSAVHLPEPSGMDLTKVGSILTLAVGLVSRPKPLSISLRKRPMMSRSVSSEKRMEYRYLSIYTTNTHTGTQNVSRGRISQHINIFDTL